MFAGLLLMLIVAGILGIFKPFMGFLLSKTILQTMFDVVFFAFSVFTKISIVIILLDNIEPQKSKTIESKKEKRKRSSILMLLMILFLVQQQLMEFRFIIVKLIRKFLKLRIVVMFMAGLKIRLRRLNRPRKKVQIMWKWTFS